MDIFYPDRPDSMRFCWALAQRWGVKQVEAIRRLLADATKREVNNEREH